MAVLTVIIIIVFQITGLASNYRSYSLAPSVFFMLTVPIGYCKSSALNLPLLGGYIDFKGYDFYREHFNFTSYQVGSAVVGGLVPTIAFVVTLFW
ncbi:hypothetical protein B0H66DRAFT_570967 [Apodospora peruviana]|uniref:Uncharacterized protein n=1 Tax=Apodospora peruviana TaxID=516989 RepID=A0AAE0HSA2_9PEZI|nr:hypothetical protein B0H66DRAFT_570967 [Apodospora peruviana]